MIKTFKYKIKPTVKQSEQLNRTFGCVRFVYNWGLDVKKSSYAESKKSVSYVDLAKMLTSLKKEKPFLCEVANESLQQSLRNLDTAFTRFFRLKKGFPKYKSRHDSKQSAKFINCVHFDFDKWKVKIPRVGWVKLCKNRTFDLSKCKLGTLTVSRDNCGEYWVSIVVTTDETTPTRTKLDKSNAVGIDLGIKDFAILSDGTKYGNPKFLEKGSERLKRLQRQHSKKKKGSKNRERARLLVARQHRRIRNRRNDFLHKITTSLVNSDYTTFCLEDLNVEGMMKNHHLARSISNAAWTAFRTMMEYKCERSGKNVIFIGRFEPSSKTCHKCGYINKDLKLSDRKWTCPNCGKVLDRDVNAAINIREIAFDQQNLVGVANK